MFYKGLIFFFLIISGSFSIIEGVGYDAYFKEKLNVIEFDASLTGFFNKLDSLLKSKSGKVNIIHIGDSHIQADFFSGEARKRFQNTFGNGGRGFVFPYQVAKSNGPVDISVNYSGDWIHSSIMKDYESETIGASGYTLFGADSATLKIRIKNSTSSNSFNKLTIFQRNGHFVLDSIHGEPVAKAIGGSNLFPYSTFLLNKYEDSIMLMAKAGNNDRLKLDGFVFENKEPGVLYHAMGTNGASTLQYLRSNSFENQMSALNADLVIISFGTNDCYLSYSRYCSSCTEARFRTLIRRIKEKNPNAAILLTTPPDHFYRRRYDNNNLNYLRKSMLKLGKEENVAVWDLYSIMGGSRSVLSWQRASLARKDLIHFSKEGYKLQGDLLFEAIMKSYENRFN